MIERPTLTTLLEAVGRGDRAAHEEAFGRVYHELKRIARGHIRRAGGALTINPSTLVHEAWLKLAQGGERRLESSQHFYNVLAQAMRQILLDLAKSNGALKRGHRQARTELTDGIAAEGMELAELMEIDDAVGRLREADPELAQLVEWHFFAGLSFVEIAALRAQNERTVRRHWDLARAFLLTAMQPGAA